MATIKSYTSLEQSRKLAEILPLESADMCYLKREINDTFIETPIIKPIGGVEKSLCCWSLAALLDILQYPILFHNGDKEWGCTVWIDTTKPYSILPKDSPIDACYEMILKLNELKVL